MTTAQRTEKAATDPRQADNLNAGRQVLNTFLLGAGTGVGGVGLYHMLRNLKERQKQLTRKPSLSETALDVNLPAVPIKQALDAASVALPLGGAGAGALLGAALSKKKNRLRNAIAGGALGGTAGLGAAVINNPAPLQKQVGQIAANSITPAWSWLFGAKKSGPFTTTENSNVHTATVAAGGLGALAGGHALNALLKNEDEKKQRDDVASSRDAYFNELLGGNEKLSEALDKLYEKHAKLSDYVPNIGGFIGNVGSGIYDVVDAATGRNLSGLSELAQTGVGLGSLAAAGLGAKHMYDKTMAKSHAKNLAAAAAARKRMQMSATPWVDPTDLAKIKDLAAAGQPSPQAG